MKSLIITVLLLLPLLACSQCPDPVHPDFAGLMEFYNATGGANWTDNTGWKEGAEGTNCDPCNGWFGVRCNGNGRVDAIDMDGYPDFRHSFINQSGNNLFGSLPDIDLSALILLNISLNNISGIIPDFGKIPNLREFSCVQNNINGQIPDFNSISSLELFYCSENLLTGEIPNFSNVPTLKSFECYSNLLEGSLPDFSNLSYLEFFICAQNSLTGSLPDFSNLPNLWSFDCSENSLMGSIPDFSNLPTLVNLNCNKNLLTGAIPDFNNLSALMGISCDENFLTGFPVFSNMPNLEVIYAEGNNFSGCFPTEYDLCDIEYFLANNPLLPWHGDYNQFCTGEDQIGAPCDDGIPNNGIDVINEDCSCGEYQMCEHPDFASLMEFYNATGGANWTDNTGWKEGAEGMNCDPCNGWYGVRCNGDGRVDAIDMDGNPDFIDFTFSNGNNLVGFIPDIDLYDLVYFDVVHNELSGSIPNFSNLPNLQTLWIASNNLTGSIPDFSNSPTLLFFDCSINNLNGSIPDFNNLPNLREFICVVNDLTDSIPDFSNLPKLEWLVVSENNLTGLIPDFSNLPTLEILQGDSNNLTGSIPDFSNLPNIRTLSFGNNNLTGSIPDFSNLPTLLSFYCSNNSLTGSIPVFENSSNLAIFKCNDNNLSGCYHNDFDYCNITYDFTNNPLLPWQGDYNKYCNGEDEIGAPCDDGIPNNGVDVINEDCSCGEFQMCDHPDFAGLMEFYNATGGPNWTDNTGWKEGAEGTNCDPCSGWYGVRCNGNGRVDAIDMDGDPDFSHSFINHSGNNLLGKLLDINLNELHTLIVSNNTIEGDIPDFSYALNLSTLSLGNNSFSGLIPDFTNLAQLYFFDCSHNDLTGNIPDFSNTPNLNYFNCINNMIEGSIPNFTKVSKLSYFYCSLNSLTGEIPDFTDLTDVHNFHCSSNKLEGPIPDFSKFTNLQTIFCFNNNLSGCYPEIFNYCNIEYSFSNNPLLPWQGVYSQFCAGEDQIGAPCDDGIASNGVDVIREDCSCGPVAESSTCIALPDTIINCEQADDIREFINAGSLSDADANIINLQFGDPAPNLASEFQLIQSLTSNTTCGKGSISRSISVFPLATGDTTFCQQLIDISSPDEMTATSCGDVFFPSGSIENATFGNTIICLMNPSDLSQKPDTTLTIDYFTCPIIITELFSEFSFCNGIEISYQLDTLYNVGDIYQKIMVTHEIIDRCKFDPDYINENGELNPFHPDNGYFELTVEYNLYTNIGENCDSNCENPEFTINLDQNSFCIGDEAKITLEGNFLPEFEYSLVLQGATLIGGAGAGPYEIIWDDTDTYSVLMEINNGDCTTVNSLNVSVEECPCELIVNDDYISFSPLTSFSYNVIDNDEYPSDGSSWLLVSETVDNLSDLALDADGTISGYIDVNFADTIQIDYQLCHPNCQDCEIGSLFISNSILEEIVLTDVISPNGDGVNDVLQFSSASELADAELIIFNRWGDKIYESETYTNNWDASGYPGGIYFYVLNYKGNIVKKTLTVLK